MEFFGVLLRDHKAQGPGLLLILQPFPGLWSSLSEEQSRAAAPAMHPGQLPLLQCSAGLLWPVAKSGRADTQQVSQSHSSSLSPSLPSTYHILLPISQKYIPS